MKTIYECSINLNTKETVESQSHLPDFLVNDSEYPYRHFVQKCGFSSDWIAQGFSLKTNDEAKALALIEISKMYWLLKSYDFGNEDD